MSQRRLYNFTAGASAGAGNPVAGLKPSTIPEGKDSSNDL